MEASAHLNPDNPSPEPNLMEAATTTPQSSQSKNVIHPVQIYISTHPQTSLIISILFLPLLIFFITPLRLFVHSQPAKVLDGECGSGRVYVYEIPEMFNRELLDHCEDLNPWKSQCDALSNDGFGPRATGLARMIPANLTPAWYWTSQFALENIFHNRIMGHRCRTTDPDLASAFFIPFYAGLAVSKFLWTNSSTHDRDRHGEMLLKWVRERPFWRRSNGWDHFIVMGRITWDFRRSVNTGWGTSFINMPAMQNITRLLIERNTWDDFDVGVPYPTGFHPRTDSDVRQWQHFVRTRRRKRLFCFVGARRVSVKNDFRGILLSQCYNESDSCRVVDCARTRCHDGTPAILETFLNSEFCLQPIGDSFTRRSIFDCMVAGSIPVFFWKRTAYYQYEWFLPGEPESYSVFIDHEDVRNGTSVKGVLQRYSRFQINRMRENVVDYIPKFVYAKPNEGLESMRDSVDVAVDGILKRFIESKRKQNERKMLQSA